ncbi:MAG: hypothetical protein D6696_19725 [Acidobacteria bacterium]|nr:MAG: hypothetical protein D6696_19725 [Acidobacteriota bacterium]
MNNDERQQLREYLHRGEVELLRGLEVAVRRARDAAHQAMFFLGLLYETDGRKSTGAVRGYGRFALAQLHGLLRPADGDGDGLAAAVEEARNALGDEVAQTATSLRLERYRQALARWDEAAAEVGEAARDPQADPLATAASLRGKLGEFLDETRDDDPVRGFAEHTLPDVLRLLRKNLALLWALGLVGFVALKVEVVNSLLRNQPIFTAAMVGVVLLPSLLAAMIRLRSRRPRVDKRRGATERVPFWDVGGRPFRSFRPLAVEPARRIRRWPQPAPAPVAGLRPAAEKDPLGRLRARLEGLFAPRKGGIYSAILYGRLGFAGFTAAVWLLAVGVVVGVFPRVEPHLTVLLILILLGAILGLARLVDFWEFLDPRPVRFLMLLAGLALLGLLLFDLERYLFVPLFASALAFVWYYLRDRSRRLRAILAGLLLVFALGNLWGGRTESAASWREPPAADAGGTPPPLNRLGLDDWPHPGNGPVVVMAASGGGSRSAVYTAFTLARLHAEHPEVAASLQAISSVSGGSLANAAYLARRLDGDDDWPGLIESLRADFLRPVLKSVAVVGLNRGDAIEKEWQGFVPASFWGRFRKDVYACGEDTSQRPAAGVALRNYCLSDLVARWRQARDGDPVPLPLPLFNASTLDGHAMVISPLSKELYVRPDLPTARPPRADPTWVFDRDGIYALEDVLGDFNPRLSAAVRASANFPFGFPLVRVETRRPLIFSPLAAERRPLAPERKPRRVLLTDGGALSNSGMLSLHNLLLNPQLAPEIKRRGLLLIIVEASKMPSVPASGKLVNLWGAIGDQAPIGQNLHRRMLDALEARYGDRAAVLQVDLIPDEAHNVLTTWALSQQAFATLERSFEARWRKKRVHLCHKWQVLTGSASARCDGILRRALAETLGERIDRERPPVD